MNKYSASGIDRNVPLFGVRDCVCAVVVACIIAIATYVRIPFFPVQFTLQTLAVVLCSAFFRRQAVLVGLGLFTSFAWIFNPLTLGYIISFYLVSFVVGQVRTGCSSLRIIGRLLCAHAMVLTIGSIWLSCCIGVRDGFVYGCLFFIPAEMIKLAIEYIVLVRFKSRS